MKVRIGLLAVGVLVVLTVLALFLSTGDVAAQDPIAERLAILARMGVKVERTPPALPPPAGAQLSPSGQLVSPRPPAVDEAALDRAARARVEKTPLAPRVKGPCRKDPELFTYIAGRKQVLKSLQAPPGMTNFPARVNFKRPIDDAKLESLVAEYHIRPGNLSYVTNSDSSGSYCYKCDNMGTTERRLHNDVDSRLRVEGYMNVTVIGTPEDLRRLDTHPDVLLVDPGTAKEAVSPNYKYVAQFPDGIDFRYELACH